MKRALRFWAFLALAVSLFVVSACAPAGVTAPASGVRKPTGEITVALAGFGPEDWRLAHWSGEQPMMVSATYEYLTYQKPGTTEVIPGLAERWEMAKDGKSATFYLRKGIPFHGDWGEFTAEDVKFTLETVAKPDARQTQAPKLRKKIESIVIDDKYKVTFRLKEPYPDLLEDLWNGYPAFLAMHSKKYVEAVGEDKAAAEPIGTGPFKFVEYKRGQYLKFEALDEHWRRVPQFKSLTIRRVPETATRIAMLSTGEADIIEIGLAAKKEVEAAGFGIRRVTRATDFYMALAAQYLPTREKYDPTIPWIGPTPERALKVRQALNLAVNRQAIIDHILGGEAVPLLGTYGFRPGDPWTDPAWKPYPYDPKRAKELLAEAGYPGGFELEMLLVPRPGREELLAVGEAVAMDWEKIGIKVKRTPGEYATHIRPQIAKRTHGRQAYPFATGGPAEPILEHFKYGYSGAPFLLGVEYPELDEVIAKGQTEIDYKKRVELSRQLGELYHKNYWSVPLASKNAIWAVSKKVGEWPLLLGNTYTHHYEYIQRAP